MPKQIIDISLPLCEALPVWPGDPPVSIVRQASQPSVSRLSLGTHAGTHVDPPVHFYAGGATVDQLDLDILMGPCWVALVPGEESAPAPNLRRARSRGITARMLEAASIPPGTKRLLLRTSNSGQRDQAFDPAFVALTAGAARWVVRRGIRLIGIDGPSIDLYDAAGEPAHRALLGAGVIVVEGLELAGVAPGPYDLACLPLHVLAGDGAPARVVLSRE